MKQHGHHPGHRPQRGAVMIMFGLMLVVLIGFAGLAIDLGRFFVIKSELQNAMDACALSAASQLRPGLNTAADLTRAVAYGRVFTTGGTGGSDAIRNKANFQSTTVNLADSDVTFADTINGPYATAITVNVDARYAKCEFPLTGLPIYFMQVLDATLSTQAISAMAVAKVTASISACAIPVGVCTGGGTNYPTPGDWIIAKSDTQFGKGFFGWIDFTEKGGGTKELKDALNSDECTPGTKVMKAGKVAGVDTWWNSRFGLYTGQPNDPEITGWKPDFTGYAYSRNNHPIGSSGLAYDKYVTHIAPKYDKYQTNIPVGFPMGKYTAWTLSSSNTAPRRLAKAPLVNCLDIKDLKTQTPISDWACVLMLNPFDSSGTVKGGDEDWKTAVVEYLGLASTPGSPCASAVTVLGQ